MTHRSQFRGRLIAATRTFLNLTAALLLLITFTPVVRWGAELLSSWDSREGEVLVMLTGATIRDPDLSPQAFIGESTYWRAVYAVDAWRRGHYRALLVSGDGARDAVKPFLLAYGVPESAILLENNSTSTRENALFSRPILAGFSGPFVLVTSDYHMYRAVRCFKRAGIDVAPRPAPDLIKRSNSLDYRWRGFWILTGEFGRILYYRARGWI